MCVPCLERAELHVRLLHGGTESLLRYPRIVEIRLAATIETKIHHVGFWEERP